MRDSPQKPPLTARLDFWSAHAPDRTALIQPDAMHSYRDLAEAANSCANGMRALGIEAGDVISLQMPNWFESVVIYLAANRIGAIANPIIPIYREFEVEFILRESRSKVLFVPASYRGRDYVQMASGMSAPDLRHVVACHDRKAARRQLPAGVLDFEYVVQRGGGDALPAPVNPQDDALLLYTSGTEANPKGVRHCHGGLEAEAKSMIEDSCLVTGDRLFMASPIGHIAGIDFAVHMPIELGGTVCLLDLWDADEAIRMISDASCKWSTGVTPFLKGLLGASAAAASLARMIGYRCGGADVPPTLIREAHKIGLFAYRTYGCTEHPTVTGRGDDADKAADTDGRPAPGSSIKIVDPDDPSRSLPSGSIGEICTKGPELFLGYRDARLDKLAFDAEGWFRTGDLGRVDADGYLTIAGRKKDIIIRKGENISAKQIEDLILEHPAIQDIAVVGLPDADRGEYVCAVAVMNGHQKLNLASISEWLDRKGLSRRKLPERLEIVPEMPRTATGKIRKAELRTRFGPNRPSDGAS